MTARRPLDQKGGGFRQPEKMGSQTQKPTGPNPASYGSADQTPYGCCNNTDVEGKQASRDIAGSWHRNVGNEESPSHQKRKSIKLGIVFHKGIFSSQNDVKSRSLARRMPSDERPIPEQLAELLRMIVGSDRAEEVNDAFQHAGDHPPITRQSLSELDIQNIINNIKLRHDVNFDRDLSFRPNFDGAKGEEKKKASARYWMALSAELQLYTCLFQRPGSLPDGRTFSPTDSRWLALVEHAKKRIPILFETIREVLKSLVPDRDQSRVDEHLDVAMLMQEIEKGVCDLVRLSEWLSNLVKEHCAPMRDKWVDRMVELTKHGVSERSSESIVKGLMELLGILESMKLDVANHQIRNLRTLLIDDTVNFERNYHLSKFVQNRARVNLEAAHLWYSLEQRRMQHLRNASSKDSKRFHLEVFVRAVVSVLFSHSPYRELPETFYLDQDRLRYLRTVIHDLVYFEICFGVFRELLGTLEYQGPLPANTGHILRASLSAILGDGASHSGQQWEMNCEYIALELVRQAFITCNLGRDYDADLVSETAIRLRQRIPFSFYEYSATVETSIAAQLLSTVNSHLHSSPLDLFNALVPPLNPPPPPPPTQYSSAVPRVAVSDTSLPYADQMLDITNRLAHIILLHWRIWGPIVYVISENDQATPLPASTSESPEKVDNVADHAHPTPLNHVPVEDAQAATPVAAGAITKRPPQESQKESQFAESTPEAATFE